MPCDIFLDTDIGTDIDDAYALVLAAVSPELRLLGVSTVNNNTVLRARIARKLLNLLARPQIPVVSGLGEAYTDGASAGWMGHEGEGIDLSDAAIEEPGEPLPDLFSRLVGLSSDPVTLVTIGALTNAAWLIESLSPATLHRIGRIVAMASTWEGFGDANAAREHNVACDPVAFDRVLRSGIPLTLVGLNVTRQTTMDVAMLTEIEAIGGPLADALVGMHRVWFSGIGKQSSPMHDALAVAAVFRPDLLATVPVTAQLRGVDGAVTYNPTAHGQVTRVEIATDVDVHAFHQIFRDRILEALRRRNRWAEREYPTNLAGGIDGAVSDV